MQNRSSVNNLSATGAEPAAILLAHLDAVTLDPPVRQAVERIRDNVAT